MMPAMKSAAAEFFLNFDIDRYLNPWIPHNRLGRVPKPISRFLGYRSEPAKEAPSYIQWIWTFVATFLGILLVGAVYKYAPGITAHHPPVIVASLGASAILDYNAIRSPLAQPRNAVLGHALSAITGVGISKLFQHNPNFEDIQWIAGAVACAVASLTMTLTNTIHPPGGATAVLAATNATTIAMGWWFVPVVMTGTLVQLGVALLINNIMRQYPIYWWTPANVGRKARKPKFGEAETKDEEKNTEEPSSDTSRCARVCVRTDHASKVLIRVQSTHPAKGAEQRFL